SATMVAACRGWRERWGSGARRSIASCGIMASTTASKATRPDEPHIEVAVAPQARLTKSRAIVSVNICGISKIGRGLVLRRFPMATGGGCAVPEGTEFLMHRLAASLLLGALLTAPAALASAQERVTVAGVEATRVVIAPPQTELARIIKTGLATSYQNAGRNGRAHEQSRQLYFFYGARHFEPLWLSEAENGTVSFSPMAKRIIDVFEAAELEGFRTSDYLTDALDVAAAGTDP